MLNVLVNLLTFRCGKVGDVQGGANGFNFLALNTLSTRRGQIRGRSRSLLSLRWRTRGDKTSWYAQILFIPFGMVRST